MTIQTSEQTGAVWPAFAKTVANIEKVEKLGHVRVSTRGGSDDYEYDHLRLQDVIDEVKRCAAENGLSVSTLPAQGDDPSRLVVSVLVVHSSGEWIMFPGVPAKAGGDPQATGGVITYLRRYALVSVFNIPTEDDDAHDATQQARRPAGERTDAEAMIREVIAGFSEADRRLLGEAFRERFGCGLTDLPASRHGDALGFVKSWTPPSPQPATVDPFTVDGVLNSDHAVEVIAAALNALPDESRAATKTAFVTEFGGPPDTLVETLRPVALHWLVELGALVIDDQGYIDGKWFDPAEPEDVRAERARL